MEMLNLPDDGTTWAEPMIKRSMYQPNDTQMFFDAHHDFSNPNKFIRKKALLSHGPQIGVELDPLELIREDEQISKFAVGYRGAIIPKTPEIVGRGEDMGYADGNNLSRQSFYRPPVPNVDQKTGRLHPAFKLPSPVKEFTVSAGLRGSCREGQKTKVRHMKRNGTLFGTERRAPKTRFIKSSFMERPIQDLIGNDIAGSAPVKSHQRPFSDEEEKENVIEDAKDLYLLNPYQKPQQLFEKPNAPTLLFKLTREVRPEIGRIIDLPYTSDWIRPDYDEYNSRRHHELKKFDPRVGNNIQFFHRERGYDTHVRRGGDVRTDRPYIVGQKRDDTRPRQLDRGHEKIMTHGDYFPMPRNSNTRNRQRNLDETVGKNEKSTQNLNSENRNPLSVAAINLPRQDTNILLKKDEDDIYDYNGITPYY